MKRLLILLSSLAICYNTTAHDDCTSFNTALVNGCSALGSVSDICIWSNSKCIPSYTNCEDYRPASGFDDATCELISPSESKYKCIVKINAEGTKICDKELKECADHDSKDNCIDLKAGENQRCVLLNGKCQSHYDDCSQVTDQNICNSNIPKDTSKKCVWNGSCGETDRLCEDYITYNDKYINNEHSQTLKSCLELKAETNKICIYEDSKECKQYYEKCEIANNNKDLCLTIKPLNAGKTGFDHLNKCDYSTTGSTCTKQLKECKDYIKGEDDGTICVRLKSSDEDNKFCYYDTLRDECPEIYITCENYDLVVTDSAQRTAPECESITPRDTSTKTEDFYSICDLDEVDSNSCKTIKRPCNKIQTKNICNSQTSDDGNKRCLYTGTTCKEIYKTCELYDTSVTTNKNKEDCEIIEPKYDGDTSIYKCIFDDSTSSCSQKKLTCEDYTGRDENYCKSLSVNLDGSHKCAMIGGKCIEQFKDCTSYTEKNKTICESIVLYDQPNYKCILHQDKVCKLEQKLCSEYLGKIASECLDYKASVDTKICAFENNKCVENSIYKYCSDYRGTNKEECESIKPYHIDTGATVDPSSKCVYTNEGCVRKSKECGDATSETECSTIIPTNDKKQCVYINNKCIEQYKGCELYHDNEETISDTICESIIINDGTHSPSTHRCVYGAPTSGAKGTCTTQTRTCIYFKPELIKSQCTSIELNDETKKCVYDSTNIICSANYKSCLELSTLANANDDKCKNALTSTNKSCVAKKDRSGCEEIEKQTESQPTNKASNTQDQKQETAPNEEEKNNYGGIKNLNKFIFIVIYLLF